MRGNFYSPLRYPGGKNCIFSFVSNFFHENNLIGISYAEPYAGGAGLALRLLVEGYVNKIYINDFDPSIYAFWDAILHRTEEFCDWISIVDIDIENWHYYKRIQNSPGAFNQFELAQSTFFLNRTNVSGVIKGGVIGGIKQLGKYKIHARFNKQELIERIKYIAKFKKQINISKLDGIDFIRKMSRKHNDIFIYLDPPYYKKGKDLYMNSYKNDDHQQLAKQIRKIQKRWMISYDKQDFILKLYRKNPKVIYKLSQCASNRIGDEVLIFSNQLIFNKSILKLQAPHILK